MNNFKIKIKKLNKNAKIPVRATNGSAGLDLAACIDAPIVINPGDLAVVPTGLAIELPTPELAAFVYARSGLGVKHGICLSNGVGVIDSDYRGEIKVGLCNVSAASYTVNPGDRIAQLVVAPVLLPQIEEVAELNDTQRSGGGFGSSGK
ncbi:MAG: dUTP diphosphatase [Oscillospiraceae bacterium]|jgi:dUTP pyrophosphatase|nr:dUTP diphosphatase [Oscillospiraceae bacterium]